MYQRVEAALKSLGLLEAYLKIFQENEMGDDSLVTYMESGLDLLALLEKIIPALESRAEFIRAFNKAHISGDDQAGQATATEILQGSTVPAASNPPNFNIIGGSGETIQPPENSSIDSVDPSRSSGGNNSPVRQSNDRDIHLQGERPKFEPGATSVQIMEFEGGKGVGKTRKAILFENEFRQVIEKSDPKRPVAVLAIAGKANKGKSLFLSYVLRYLTALQQGQKDWMGWNDKSMKPLEGFRWANGYDVVTKGIWIWPEPITCKNGKGQEFDVLLMDTQGVFDEKTGQREWNILAGLGIITSSVMIFNTSQDVQEDTLVAFQSFLSFGLLALDRDDSSVDTKPFQNLVFLVRDWENHEEFPFGHEGGRRFITKKLEEKSDHDVFHRELRKHMKKCFVVIDCFLFPYPGKSVRESSFTGSVVNASEDYRSFAKEIQNCIEQLVHPDNFPLKTLNGNVLSAQDVFDIFKSYIEIFNSDELPTSNDLYKATAERCNAVVISKCVIAYAQALESRLSSSVPFLEENELMEIKETAEEDADSVFKKSRKMGDSEVISAAKEELKAKLAEKYCQFVAQNEIRKEAARREMEAKVREILATYDTEMNAIIGNDVLEEDQVHSIYNELTSVARKKFQDFKFHRPLEDEGLTLLWKHLQSPDEWLERVRLNREKLEVSITNLVTEAQNDYESALDPSNFNDWTSMATAEAEARQKTLGVLKEFSSKLSESKIGEIESELTSYLDATRMKVAKELANHVFKKAKKEFKEGLRGIVETTTDEEVFNSKVADLNGQIRSQLEKSIQGSVIGPDGVEENMSKWNEVLQKLVSEQKDLFGRSKRVHELPKELESQLASQNTCPVNAQRESKPKNVVVPVPSVTPFSIGIESSTGMFEVLIPKGKQIPCVNKERRYTARDHQTKAIFNIYGGEDGMARNNRLLGELSIDLPSLRMGEAAMRLETEVDATGILKVMAISLMDQAKAELVVSDYLRQ